MNYTSAIFLTNPNVRAMATSYEVDAEGKGVKPFITYKTMDHSLEKDDYVLIPSGTRHGMAVVRIEEIDVEVDLEDTKQLGWIMSGPIDKTNYEKVVAWEAAAITAIKSAEKRAKQDELRAKLIADNPELAKLANVGAPALSAPPTPEG